MDVGLGGVRIRGLPASSQCVGSRLQLLWMEAPLMVALHSPGQICIFVGETLLFSNWAITADILMVSQAGRGHLVLRTQTS